ncbi:MAG: DUF4065 domain-containing protein [Magnetospirillum sp. WYHS-4]
MTAAVRTAFDIAFWFADTALNANEYLQPQKLHRLMFLAQAYFAVVSEGRALMPAVFVADEMGPIEPNVFAAFSKGRPDVDAELFLPEDVETFLYSVWRRFGHYSADKLTKMTKEMLAYKHAFQRGPRSEIPLDAMRLSVARAEQTPGVQQVVKPKVFRTQDGRPVTIKAWKPRAADPAEVVARAEPEGQTEEEAMLAHLGLTKPKRPKQPHPPAAQPATKAWAPKVIRRPRPPEGE